MLVTIFFFPIGGLSAGQVYQFLMDCSCFWACFPLAVP
jgi:hypothetical protein